MNNDYTFYLEKETSIEMDHLLVTFLTLDVTTVHINEYAEIRIQIDRWHSPCVLLLNDNMYQVPTANLRYNICIEFFAI